MNTIIAITKYLKYPAKGKERKLGGWKNIFITFIEVGYNKKRLHLSL